MLKQIVVTTLLLIGINLFAHEGHDNAPGSLKANHGGVVLAGKQINLEYVVAGTEVKLHPVSHEGKDLTASEVKVTATTKLPKGKAEVVKLENKEGAFVTAVDFKNAYRVEMSVSTTHNGKIDTFKFQIEK